MVGESLRRYSDFADALAGQASKRLRAFAAMRHGVSLRLFVSIVLFSATITLFLTALELYADYRRDVSALEGRLEEISKSYQKSLAEGLWSLDEKQLRLQLAGILRLPDLRAVEVREAITAGDPFVVRAGHDSSALPDIAQEYPLRYNVQGQDRVIGTFHIEATLAGIHSALFDRALTTLSKEAATIFLVSLFAICIFHFLVTRHLFAIANFVGDYRITDPPSHLRLRRSLRRHEDELGRVVTAFNALSDDLQIAYRSLHDANDRLARDVAARRQIEAVLREREARIRRLVDANIIGIFTWKQGQIVEANDAFLRIVGHDREDIVSGRVHWTELTPPEWRDRGARATEELKRTGIAQPFEREYFRKDGSRIPVLIGAASFNTSENEGVAFVLDLTDRKRADEALRASEERFRTLMQFSFDVYWETDAQHRVIRQEFAEGLAEAPVRGSELGTARWDDPYLEPDAEAWRKHRETVEAHLPFRDFELARPTPDGGKRYVSVSGLPMFDASGRFIGHRGVGRHITERKLAEEAVKRAEKELRQVVETIPAMVWAASPDGHVEFINRRWQEFTGLTLDKTLGWKWETEAPFHPEDFKGYLDKWNASLAAGQPFEAEMRIRCAVDGAYRWLFESAVPLRDEQGNILKWYGFVFDIEDRKRAEEALQKATFELAHTNRVATMGQLAASIAHEVNQPITAARNNASAALRFLDRNPPDLEEVREALGCIVNDAERAGSIVARIRDHIKKVPPRKESLDINDAISEVIALTRNEVTKNGISIETSLAKGLCAVQGDRVQLQQVVMNLVLNATEAMSSDSDGLRELLISTEQSQEDGIVVAVRDTGPGIDPDDVERVFQSFYTTKSSGIGMGLSICRSIIEAHGGRLWATANVPRGAAFYFALSAAVTDS